MKPISKALFGEALKLALKREEQEHDDMANYIHNLRHNVGRYKYQRIDKCGVNGFTYYCSPCLRKAYDNISEVKRQITRLGY